MADRSADARALDIAAFCRQGAQLQGEWPLDGMPRLASSLSGVPTAAAQWSARGSLMGAIGGQPQLCLQLRASAQVMLQCQRCLQAMAQQLEVDRGFRFVRGEALAAQLDEDADDDVLAVPQRLDLHGLLEDELILALPLVARHALCPQPLPLVGDSASQHDDEPADNPFAALAALRGRKSH